MGDTIHQWTEWVANIIVNPVIVTNMMITKINWNDSVVNWSRVHDVNQHPDGIVGLGREVRVQSHVRDRIHHIRLGRVYVDRRNVPVDVHVVLHRHQLMIDLMEVGIGIKTVVDVNGRDHVHHIGIRRQR